MPHHFANGAMSSSNFMMYQKNGYWLSRFTDNGTVKARVDEVLYTDDPRNTTSKSNHKQTQYVLTVLDGPGRGQKIFNAISTVPMGGAHNSGEVIHAANLSEDTAGKSPKLADQTQGAIVLVNFLQGDIGNPVITGSLKHPKSTVNSTKAGGPNSTWEYNGIRFSINKDGELSISYGGGPKSADGTASNAAGAGMSIAFSKTGSLSIGDGQGQSIEIDRATKKISFNSSAGIGMNAGSNWDVNISGNVNLNAGGAMNLGGAVTSLGGGGLPAARMNDIVLGVDSMGGPINAFIGMGSGTVLVGG